MEKTIKQLIEKELTKARILFPEFHSSHEGFAVIMEELEEMKEEHDWLHKDFKMLFSVIRQNSIEGQKAAIKSMKITIINLIKEAVQVAAMIEKYDQDVK